MRKRIVSWSVLFCKSVFLLAVLLYYFNGRSWVQAKRASHLRKEDGQDKVFVQTATMRTETIFFVQFLEELHFLKKPLSEVDSKKLIEEFLITLDTQRMFFTQNDVNQFVHQFAMSLELLLRGGSLTPAFTIFNKYRMLAARRIDWIQRRLQGKFNFTKHQFYESNRKDAPWGHTSIDLDILWEQRLQHELLNEALATQSSEMDSMKVIEDGLEGLKAPKENRIDAEQCLHNLENAKVKLAEQYTNLGAFVDKIDAVDIQELFLNTLTHFYDPHTSFLSNDSMEDFSISLHNSLVGIGAYLGEENGMCVIKELLPGGPAERNGNLHPGDKILAVAQDKKAYVNIQGMKLRQSVKLMRGPRGTKVRLMVQPFDGEPSERKEIELVRDEIKLTNNLASARVFCLPDAGGRYRVIGLIDLPAFYGSDGAENEYGHRISEDVKVLIRRLEYYHLDGLILDLRRNGGGLLTEAVKLAGLFLDHCPVVQIKDTTGKVTQQFAAPHSCLWKGPLLILTSRLTASASEIVAGALQAYHRALIFGDRTTHGKGTVQAVIEMDKVSLFPCAKSTLGAAKITLQKWYLPNGKSTQKRGVFADVSLPSLYDILPVGESDAPNALEWDCIQAMGAQIQDPVCRFVKQGLLQYLWQCQHERQKVQPAYAVYRQQIEDFKSRYEQSCFTLNLQERIHQLNEDRASRNALNQQADMLKKWQKHCKKIYLPDATAHDKHENFDIYEDEVVQMMLDWLYFLHVKAHYALPSYCSHQFFWDKSIF